MLIDNSGRRELGISFQTQKIFTKQGIEHHNLISLGLTQVNQKCCRTTEFICQSQVDLYLLDLHCLGTLSILSRCHVTNIIQAELTCFGCFLNKKGHFPPPLPFFFLWGGRGSRGARGKGDIDCA